MANYDDVEDIESIQKKLRAMQWELDRSEYDDEEEWERVYARLYPAEVRKLAKRAAELGLVQGMHLYGRLLADEAFELEKAGKSQVAQVDEGREWVMRAALAGCWGAMDDLGTENTASLRPSRSESLAFHQLSGENPDRLVEYCRETLGIEITREEIDEGRRLFEGLRDQMEARGISKRACECIFP